MYYTTSCNTQSSAPEDGQNNCPKHVELTGITRINKPLLLHLVGCLYLYQWCTVKQISDNEIYLLIKYIKFVLWRVSKRLSYIEDTRCLKVKWNLDFLDRFSKKYSNTKFKKVRSVVAELLHADRRTDGHDEANSRFSQFWQWTWNLVDVSLERVHRTALSQTDYSAVPVRF